MRSFASQPYRLRFSKRTTPLLLFRFANLVARRSIIATVSGGIHTPDTVDAPIFASIRVA